MWYRKRLHQLVKWRIGTGLIFLAGITQGTLAQEIRPYLQTPTDTSIRITWKTDSDPESIVFYGKDSLALTNQATGDCQVLSDNGYDQNYYYHNVHLISLEPDQFYYYRVVSGIHQSSIYRFRTQPSPGNEEGIYRFLVFGDHQVKGSDRYERLLIAAREKIFEKFGGSVEEHVNLVINDGDQVDQGTLDQYEFVHFGPSAILSGNVPVMTTVGNHETYGSLGLSAYYAHFFYDSLGYRGIPSPGGENYYSYQQKNVVFIHLSSEHPNDDQVEWVRQIVDSVKTDPDVDWIVSIAHRPIQAEQFVGDISQYVRDRIIPVLAQTEKSSLFIGGHHHLYARGQVRDFPMYHIISGGGSWDQFWGQSTEKDFDDVQKTIDFWTYQIVTIDAGAREMLVECYAIGSPKLGFTLDNILIDSFYRRFPAPAPATPSIINAPVDTVELPVTLVSSPYPGETPEPYNSVQFQVSSDQAFSGPEVDLIRDFENLYGTTGSPDYLPVDIHDTVDIFKYRIRENTLPNGTYYARVRHRDRNITWSGWSEPVQFSIRGSTGGPPSISTTKSQFEPGENIVVDYEFGPGNERDWIGIYRYGEIPGTIASTDWEYISGSTGSVILNVAEPGQYFIGLFEDDGYFELAPRRTVYVVSKPVLSLNQAGYAPGESIEISFSNAPGITNDWIGIYRLDDTPGDVSSTQWAYTSGTSGTIPFGGLDSGYYFAAYFLNDGYVQAGERIIFSVGSDLASLLPDSQAYHPGEPIQINYMNSPGLSTDWIGIFDQNAPPGTAPLVDRRFLSASRTGQVIFDTALDPGPYYAAMYINNSSIRISNKAYFSVVETTGNVPGSKPGTDFQVIPAGDRGTIRIIASPSRNQPFSVRIFTATGSVVCSIENTALTAGYSEVIDLSGTGPGIYLATFRNGTDYSAKKFILF